MRHLIVVALLFAPMSAFASSHCNFSAPRNLQADLTGVRAVRIEVNSHDLHLKGVVGTPGLNASGRACASDQSALDGLQITQRREGDQLLLELGGNSHSSFKLLGSSYTYLEITMQLPPNVPVTVNVGSGDADVTGLQQLQGQVGSGDLTVSQLTGKFGASVGSGDINASDIGSLDLGSVGSGDFNARGIKGDARIGSIGSGDVDLRDVGGNVHADTLGSGDLKVGNVAGDFSLGAKGSGDVSHSGVKGKLSVPRDDD